MAKKQHPKIDHFGAGLGLHDDRLDLKAVSYPGMAHFGATGPASKQCRECEHFVHAGYWADDGNIKPGRCAKFAALMRLASGPAFPATALSCKFFAGGEPHAVTKGGENERLKRLRTALG